jgi:hypothetical protein
MQDEMDMDYDEIDDLNLVPIRVTNTLDAFSSMASLINI